MRVRMVPHLSHFRSEESGIKRVVEAYFLHLGKFGVELVDEGRSYDLLVAHINHDETVDVCHNHGLYWTADYPAVSWEWAVNAKAIDTLRRSRHITVPSSWVAESFTRDMRRSPHVVPHGIDWDAWQHDIEDNEYVLWNKNRISDVCNPEPVMELARTFTDKHFVTTFAHQPPSNVDVIGLIPHDQMKQLVQGASVYLATVKETFGIGILEAMAAGVPVLGYAHGGILDLVQHGVNGYLAQPWNQEDLAQGLAYCLQHRKVLGANGREMAREWTWERVAEQVANIYTLAMQKEKPTVSVVIPCYDYADKVGRAIESAINQTYDGLTSIIVVDDGSRDVQGVAGAVQQYIERDDRVRFVRQDNQGVAVARNRGIIESGSKYVACLDADDAIEPVFLERCIAALEEDYSLGIAYTALRYIRPNEETGISPWPGEWVFDDQLARRNQVPTCCVFRREMWDALGGYRSRYCPHGAGSEDAEFWTRSGAYGWAAKKVTAEPLFVYSWQSGRVSGNPDYSETDWLAWHPWATDGKHPFASYAKTKRWSHPVRQYDEPIVSVVIPVGPGHEDDVWNALDSLDAQTFRGWEGIIVWDCVVPKDKLSIITNAFPHIRYFTTQDEDENNPRGPGVARNIGAENARAPFLLFLDADDWLYPECLEKMLDAWDREEGCVYSGYVGKAFIENPKELAKNLKLLYHNPDGESVIEYPAQAYDWKRAQQQPAGNRPWIWCNITTLVPRAWHNEVGGFDESLKSWEDVDYWWRLAKAGKPFTSVQEPLMVYRFYSGGRRDIGYGISAELLGLLAEKHKEIETVGCSGCGGRRNTTPPSKSLWSTPTVSSALENSDEFILCTYNVARRGKHQVVGQAGFNNRFERLHMVRRRGHGMLAIHYGYRQTGERFLVHREDVKLAPQVFVPVENNIPKQEAQLPPAPVQMVQPEEQKPQMPPGLPEPELISIGDGIFVPHSLADNGKLDLSKVPGITPNIAKQLIADKIETRDGLLRLGMEKLQLYHGVGPARARLIIEAVTPAE